MYQSVPAFAVLTHTSLYVLCTYRVPFLSRSQYSRHVFTPLLQTNVGGATRIVTAAYDLHGVGCRQFKSMRTTTTTTTAARAASLSSLSSTRGEPMAVSSSEYPPFPPAVYPVSQKTGTTMDRATRGSWRGKYGNDAFCFMITKPVEVVGSEGGRALGFVTAGGDGSQGTVLDVNVSSSSSFYTLALYTVGDIKPPSRATLNVITIPSSTLWTVVCIGRCGTIAACGCALCRLTAMLGSRQCFSTLSKYGIQYKYKFNLYNYQLVEVLRCIKRLRRC